jgi:hypothetical protein
MNLAILILDFLSYEFLEGSVSYYPKCDSCDLDSLPFDIEFKYPMDYGEITFRYSYNFDTAFRASIWWMGTGHILHPDAFLPSNEFDFQDEPVQLPIHVQYFDYWLTPYVYPWEQFVEKADSAWNSIDSLQIVKEFSEYTYRVGIYAYTPVVGMFDPEYAKWIIFIYYGNTHSTGLFDPTNEKVEVRAYPNPFTTSITISFALDGNSNIQVSIINNLGEEVYRFEEQNLPQGKHSITPSLHHLPSGMYYGVLKTDKGNSMLKMIKQ